jgi:Ca2+-binding RTX toxin-like protein
VNTTPIRRRAGLIVATSLVISSGAIINGSPAGAVPGFTCTHDAANAAVNVNLESVDIALARVGDAIMVGGAACGAATVFNTDTVTVTGSPNVETFRVSLGGGPLAPGLTQPIDIAVDLGAQTGTDSLLVHGLGGPDTIEVGSVAVDLDGNAEPDLTYVGVEQIIVETLDGADRVSGQGGPATGGIATVPLILAGGPGDDTLVGGDGRDLLHGGLGNDLLDGAASTPGGNGATWQVAPGPVVVDLSANAASGADGNDVVMNVTSVLGSSYDDTLRGTNATDSLAGGPGNDTLIGLDGDDELAGHAGTDSLDGGNGTDYANYAAAPAGVTVDLTAGIAQGGEGNDTLAGIERAIGTQYPDQLIGDAASNLFFGLAGNDVIEGRGNDDGIYAGDGNDHVTGGDGNDGLDGEAGNDLLAGGEGNDHIVGGLGQDLVTYGDADGSVVVNLTTGLATGAWGNDMIATVENIGGSAFRDLLQGDAFPNVLYGRSGPDTIIGFDGDDTLYGGIGNDRLDGGIGNDLLDGGTGTDVCNQGLGVNPPGYPVGCP